MRVLVLTLSAAMLLACASSAGRTGPTPTETGRVGGEEATGGAGTGGKAATGGTGGRPLEPDAAAETMPDAAETRPDVGVDRGADDGTSPDASSDRPGADTAPKLDGGADAGVAYNPCPPKGTACVVLPLGDSLTQGAGSSDSGGYRSRLFHQVLSHGKTVTFVGSAASGPTMVDGMAFPRRHEGHGGFSIGAIGQWLTDNNTIATYKPNIVLLHIGTNNGLRHPGADVPAVLTALGALIDQITAADPRALVLVALIIPSTSDDGVKQTAAYNAGIPAVVAARAAAGKHVVVADVQKAFVADPNWKTDYLPTSDVHPIDAGYEAMARGWYDALGPLLR